MAMVTDDTRLQLHQLVDRNAKHWALSSVNMQTSGPLDTVCDADHSYTICRDHEQDDNASFFLRTLFADSDSRAVVTDNFVSDVDVIGRADKERPRKLFSDFFINQLLQDAELAATKILEARKAVATEAAKAGTDAAEDNKTMTLDDQLTELLDEDGQEFAPILIHSFESPDEAEFAAHTFDIITHLMLFQLSVSGQLDAGLLNWNFLSQSCNKLRVLWAGLPAHSIVAEHVHDRLLSHLPASPLASCLSLLKFMKNHFPDCFRRVFVLQGPSIDKKSFKEPLLAFFENRFSEKLTLAPCVQPLRRLPSDCLAVLLSPSVRIAGESLNSAFENAERFYRVILPEVVQCIEVKHPPLRKGLRVSEIRHTLMRICRDKIQEIVQSNQDRRIILVGWDMSCSLVLSLLLELPCTAGVLFAFGNVTIGGIRGWPDDAIININKPVLWIAGQNSPSLLLNDLHELRHSLMTNNAGIVIVSGANEQLVVNGRKLLAEHLTQDMANQCVTEMVVEFLYKALNSPNLIVRPEPLHQRPRRLLENVETEAVYSKRRKTTAVPARGRLSSKKKRGRLPKIRTISAKHSARK